MNRRTVDAYSDAEFEKTGISGAIKNKKKRRSILLPLLLSVTAAVVIWLFVLAENNTCAGITVKVVGNEQLMSYNYTVSEPATIRVVLRGKSEVINRIKADKSLISASIYVFPTKDSGENGYLFSNPGEVKAGERSADVVFSLPEGVTCSKKTVKVIVSESYSKKFSSESFTVNLSNYSLAEGIDIVRKTVAENTLTVSGDEDTVNAISSIGFNLDWRQEISGNLTEHIQPVAYDAYGGEIQATYLHFEPEQFTVNVEVQKTKTFRLSWKNDDKTVSYALTPETVTLTGPVQYIDLIGAGDARDTIVIGDDASAQEKDSFTYDLDASRFGASVSFLADGETSKTAKIGVTRTSLFTVGEVRIPVRNVTIIPPKNAEYSILEEYAVIKVRYFTESGKSPSPDAFFALLDLSFLPEKDEKYNLAPDVFIKPNGENNDFEILSVPSLSVYVKIPDTN